MTAGNSSVYLFLDQAFSVGSHFFWLYCILSVFGVGLELMAKLASRGSEFGLIGRKPIPRSCVF
jgi:hypothetical protein